MGCRGASLTHHPPQYVPVHHQGGAEGSREVHLPRTVAEPAKARPQGQCTCHATCRVPERDQGPLLWSIFTKKVTQLTALQALMQGGGYPGHPALPEELLAQAGGTAMLEEDQWVLSQLPPSLSTNWNPNLGSRGEKTHMMRPSERPERLTSGYWRPPTWWNWILKD